MHHYKVKFYLCGEASPVEIDMFKRDENMEEFVKFLTQSTWHAAISDDLTVIINMPNVTKIHVWEI